MKWDFHKTILLVWVGVLLLQGCGTSTANKSTASVGLEKTCILPNSIQDNSLMGHWQTSDLAIKVALHTGSSWNSTETQYVTAAADTWNSFFQSTKGGSVIDYGASAADVRSSSRTVVTPDCTQPTPSDGAVIYKRGTWTKGASLIALTSFCKRTVSGAALPIMYNAIMELNYQNYFVESSRRFPDLQSIVLHEMGHLLGLDHSCDSTPSSRAKIACPTDGQADEYGLKLTVMYPDWTIDSSGAGEVKRVLQQNDQGRANCLY